MAKKFACTKVLNATQQGCDAMSSQLAIPVPLRPEEVTRKGSFGGAIALCLEAAEKDPKDLIVDLKLDKAQISRWTTDAEGILWQKLQKIQDYCGNKAPVLWLAHASGFDISSMRPLESETERQNRLLREENAALRRVLQGAS